MYFVIGCYDNIGSNILLLLRFAANFNFAHLLLFDAFIDLGRRLLVGSEQADDAGPLRVQNIPVVISDHLIQFQDPAIGRGQDAIEKDPTLKWRNQRSRAASDSRSSLRYTLVAIVDLGGDFLLQLLELVTGQRARQELGPPLH